MFNISVQKRVFGKNVTDSFKLCIISRPTNLVTIEGKIQPIYL